MSLKSKKAKIPNAILQRIGAKRLAIILFSLLLIGFGWLLILPADYFNTGSAKCISVVLFDQECYGCGMTRGIQHLIHGKWSEAWSYNKLSFVVLPLGVGLLVWELWKLYRTASAPPSEDR